jgi:hypothetical protein
VVVDKQQKLLVRLLVLLEKLQVLQINLNGLRI